MLGGLCRAQHAVLYLVTIRTYLKSLTQQHPLSTVR